MAFVPSLFARATNANGTPESGAKRSVFLAGTTTPTTTFSDSALTTPQAFPLEADAGGAFATSYLPAGRYKIRVTDADDNLLMPEHDNIRLADRPDDPIFLDDRGAVLSDTTSYATGTVVYGLQDGARFEIAASGATDHTDTRNDGQKLYNLTSRNSKAASYATSLPDGTIFEMDGLKYEVDASATGLGSCTDDLGQDGLIPFGDISPKHFGDTVNSASVQAAINFCEINGGRLTFPKGVFEIKGITINGTTSENSGEGVEIFAPRGAYLQNKSGLDGTSMFIIGGSSATNFLKIDIANIEIAAGGGHAFELAGDLNHSSIFVSQVLQREPTKSIIDHNDTSFFFNDIKGDYWSITTSHSVPALAFSSTSNKVSANKFEILRPDRSGTRHFMEILSTSGSDFNYSNDITLANPERCDGGVLKLQRAMNTVVHKMNCFDNLNIVNDMIQLGDTGFICQNTKIYDYQRNAGTLASGKKDIAIIDANYTRIENPSGVSTARLAEIDAGEEPNTMIFGGGFLDVVNLNDSSGVLISGPEGITTSTLKILPQGAIAVISAGEIDLAGSVTRVDTEASAATDDLETINGGSDGQICILRSTANTRDVTLKDAFGNLLLAGDFTLSRDQDTITLRFDGLLDKWVEISRSDNAA